MKPVEDEPTFQDAAHYIFSGGKIKGEETQPLL